MSVVSVIIPNYNHGRYLEKRIHSVLDQTFQDFEVIILDDASTDNSRDVIEHYRPHPKVADIVYNDRNSGSTFKQWNRGVRMARGEYVWLAESDDYADPGFLSVMVDVLDRHPNVGLAYCNSWHVDGPGKLGKQTSSNYNCVTGPHNGDWSADLVLPGKEMIRRHLLKACTIFNASAVVFRKAAYIQAGGANEGFRLAGDWDMYTRVLAQNDYAYVANPLNYHRSHEGTVRRHMANSVQEMWELSVLQHRLLHVVKVHPEDGEVVTQCILKRVIELRIPRGSRWAALWCLAKVGCFMDPHIKGYWHAVAIRLIDSLRRFICNIGGVKHM